MQVTFLLRNGEEKTVEFRSGQTLLNLAHENGIEIQSNCEGFGVCGKCHVQIENLQEKLLEPSEKENDVLDRVINVGINSRLSCQIILDESLNGLRVKIM